MLIVRTPVRISFGGGGTDLPAYYEEFGGAVLSASINHYFYTVLNPRSDRKIQVISSDLRVMETWQDLAGMDIVGDLEIPLAALKELGRDVAVDLFMASEIPPGTGLGSSAAVAVNVVKTLAVHLGLPLSKYDIAEQAFHIARDILHKPVGKQDEYATSFGGLNYISFHANGSTDVNAVITEPALLRELEDSLMLFYTGAAHHSWTILCEQEKAIRSTSSCALDALHEIRRLADCMRDALLEGDLHRFGQLLHNGWELKKKVSSNISNASIDELYDLARANGALGGKITGAGGGGFLLLFCEPDRQAGVRTAFESVGIREMTFRFDFYGAHVVANDPFLESAANGGRDWVFVSVPVQAL